MSTTEKYRPNHTYSEYCLWEGKWELIEVMPYAMSPAPGLKQQRTASRLNALFLNALSECKKCTVYEPIDWKITEDTVLQPDLSIIFRPVTNNNYLDFPPALVLEILSVSTAKKDRREKFELYQQQKVKYYLLIDPGFNKIEIFEYIDQSYQLVSISPPHYNFQLEDCGASLDFEGLFDE